MDVSVCDCNWYNGNVNVFRNLEIEWWFDLCLEMYGKWLDAMELV